MIDIKKNFIAQILKLGLQLACHTCPCAFPPVTNEDIVCHMP